MPKTMVVNGSIWQILYSYKNTHALLQKGLNGLNTGIIYDSLTGKSKTWF